MKAPSTVRRVMYLNSLEEKDFLYINVQILALIFILVLVIFFFFFSCCKCQLMSHNFQVTRVNFFCFFSSGKRYRIWDATCSFCQVLNLSWYILMLAKRLALKMYVPVHKLSNYLIKQRFFFLHNQLPKYPHFAYLYFLFKCRSLKSTRLVKFLMLPDQW